MAHPPGMHTPPQQACTPPGMHAPLGTHPWGTHTPLRHTRPLPTRYYEMWSMNRQYTSY